jgi:hypothetical protein
MTRCSPCGGHLSGVPMLRRGEGRSRGAIDRSPVHGLEQLTAHLLPRMSETSVSQISKNPPMANGALIGPHSRTLHKGDLTRVGIRQVHERNRQRVTRGLLIPL